MRTPAVTLALLIILALGFGTAAVADDGGSSSGGSSKTASTPTATTTTPRTTPTAPQGTATGSGKPKTPGSDGTATTPGQDTTTGTGTDDTATTPSPAPAPAELAPAAAPVLGESAAVKPISGDVRVKLPGREDYVALGDAASIPMGATVDATKGTVSLTSAHNAAGTPQTAHFHDGSFKVVGQTSGAKPVTELVLTGGDFAACAKSKLTTAKHPPVRQLWGSGHGRFTTRGRYSAATVRGTIWLTRDSCDGTLTIVKRGVVAVRDRVRDKTVMVRAGNSYFARAPLPVSAATRLLGF